MIDCWFGYPVEENVDSANLTQNFFSNFKKDPIIFI